MFRVHHVWYEVFDNFWTGRAPHDINNESEWIILFFILHFSFRLCNHNNQSMTKASMRGGGGGMGRGVSIENIWEEVGRDK